MLRFMGIDTGSEFTKGVITGADKILAQHIIASGINYKTAALTLRAALLENAGLREEDITSTLTTGYGEGLLPFSCGHAGATLCCARGIRKIFPPIRTVIDIQGQSSQIIKLNEDGQISGFAVNDICASGSGYFLTVIAEVLQIDIKEIGALSLKSKNPVTFTTGCAVFGESEAISRVAEGIPKEDILAGVNRALAGKISSLINGVGLEKPCAISGGGGLNTGLVKSLFDLGIELEVPSQPQLVNALGAAIIAEEQTKR